MKAKHCLSFLLLLSCFLILQKAGAQRNSEALNIRGDTLYLNLKNSVAIVFPAAPSKANINEPDGSYEVDNGGKNSLSIKAVKTGAMNQILEVVEGGRNHLFVLSYNDTSPAYRIDLSTRRKLGAYAIEKRKNVSNALLNADSVFTRAVNDSANQRLWELVEATYKPLEKTIDSKEGDIVKSRLEESRKAIVRIKENKYAAASKKAQDYFFAKKYKEAKLAYQEALEFKPEDPQALKNINVVDSVWVKEALSKGDEANKSKIYILAKTYYKEAYSVKPNDPVLLDKYNQIKKVADPLIYKLEKDKGDLAFKKFDMAKAKSAYDSALSVQPDNKYISDQLKKVNVEAEKIKEEERQEAKYQEILTNAKRLAETASNRKDWDLVIAEYRKASAMFSSRKFPQQKIDEFTRLRNRVAAN